MRIIPILLLLAVMVVGCGMWSGNYGRVTIEAPNGEKFYFRRQVRGNFEALALSADSNVCAKPDPAKALIFRAYTPVVFYRFEGNELHIYKMSTVDVPTNFSKTIRLVLHDITNPEFIALRTTHTEKGLEASEVPVDTKLSCWF